MEQTLGFRVIEWQGVWQLQTLNEEGKVTNVKPILHKEIWELWVLVEAQWTALAETSPK